MELRENNIIHINLSDIQEMVSECFRKISLLYEDRKPAGYWTKEKCYDEAKKYNSKADFVKNNAPAYQVALKNGWLKDYTWFKKLSGKWDKEACYNEAKKYNSVTEFHKGSKSAYTSAWKNGWLSDYDWFKNPKIKWDKESCHQEAKKYNSCADFERNNATAYNKARKNGWIKDYTWFNKRVLPSKDIYIVYCYKNEETNSVYVGLTNNMKKRHRQHVNGHLKNGETKYDIVYRYFHSINKDIPEPIILKKDLSAENAQHYEGYYVEHFKNEGYNVINLAKTGSLGGYTKWTRESCYNEARKYNSMGEFKKGNASAYKAAKDKGWIDDYYWFPIPKKHWDYESCYNEAEKYNSRTEFQNGSKGAYKSAWTNGWLDDFDWLSRK